MESKIRFTDRLRYAVDNTFSKGTTALILWLGFLSTAIILTAAAVICLFRIPVGPSGEPVLFHEAAWGALMRALDAGAMDGDEGWWFRGIMLVVTLGGIFILSTLIGILTSAVEGRLNELRKGHSRVLESGHTIILGWSEQIFTILSELVEANANQPKSCVVILADKDKVEMEDAIRVRVGKSGKTRIVCRRGSPIELTDLAIVSLNTSRSIIILSPEGTESPDAEVIKTILAITNLPGRREDPFHIVAEFNHPCNSAVAGIVGGDEVETIQTGEIIAHIIAQTCCQSGLSQVYTELLDFSGDEIYIQAQPELTGKTYGEILNAYRWNTVIGLAKKGQTPVLNPPMDTRLEEGDGVILIAADDDQVFLNGEPEVKPEKIDLHKAPPAKPKKTILLGWNRRVPTILRELDQYVAPDSEIMIVADLEGLERQVQEIGRGLNRQKVRFQEGDITDRSLLEAIGLPQYDHIVLLCYADALPVQKADAKTLITLLHLRDIAEKHGCAFSIVSEMLDIRNRDLAEVSQADDFIVSDKLVSLLLTQVAENKQLHAVFQDLFNSDGSEVYLWPASEYVRMDSAVNFYTVVEAARRKNQTAIGYRRSALTRSAEQAYGVFLNPDKSEEIPFREDDRIIVLDMG